MACLSFWKNYLIVPLAADHAKSREKTRKTKEIANAGVLCEWWLWIKVPSDPM